MTKQPDDVCPMCLGPWDREAVIERRKAVTAARRADIASRPIRRRPVLLGIGEQPTATSEANPGWMGRIDVPEGGAA